MDETPTITSVLKQKTDLQRINGSRRKDMEKLNGKIALVTGASKGIGAGVALSLAKEGAAVAVNYASDRTGAERVVEKIRTAGGKAIAIQGSVTSSVEIKHGDLSNCA